MPYALVGAGAVQTGASGAAVPGVYGTGTRTVGNLLTLQVASTGSATLPAAIAGWSIAKQQAGTSCSCSIYYKVAAGGDAAPTVPLVASTVHNVLLSEFSGNAAVTPLDQTAGAAGTATPIVATTGAPDVAATELMMTAGVAINSAARVNTLTHTLNNSPTGVTTFNNNATSTVSHYNLGYGMTAVKTVADSDSMAFVATQLTGAAVALASFKLLPVPLLAGQHHRRPQAVAARRGAKPSRGRF